MSRLRYPTNMPNPSAEGALVRPVVPRGSSANANIATTTGQALASYPSPYTMIPGYALQAGGLGLQLWDQYQRGNRAEEEYKRALKEYDDQKRRMEQLDQERRDQQYLQNLVGFGEYASDIEKGAEDVYGAYNRAVGR